MTDTATADASAATTGAADVKQLSIVVADRGNVWVGEIAPADAQSPGFTRVNGARVIRRWGTTEGLNQLAKHGPQRETRLDAAADVLVADRAIIAIIPCEVAPWNGR